MLYIEFGQIEGAPELKIMCMITQLAENVIIKLEATVGAQVIVA
jgi:hypothetical protein